MTQDEREVSRLLGELRRFDAPANFEFGVKARIAAGKPATAAAASGVWLGYMKFVVPAFLLAALGGAMFFGGLAGDADVPAIAEQRVNPEAVEETLPEPVRDEASVAAVTDEPASAATETLPFREGLTPIPAFIATRPAERVVRPIVDTPVTAMPESAGGSVDRALSPAIEVNLPLAPVDYLKKYGIDAAVDGEVWRVASVAAGSPAAAAGLKSGDVIESIGGRKPATNPTFQHSSGPMALVLRDEGSFRIITID
ncbi:MAG: PDZ domain-containing protein [Blastocatellia bacterium]|nr:PDZ domain-containing protein [Blastocatellia bacterium]